MKNEKFNIIDKKGATRKQRLLNFLIDLTFLFISINSLSILLDLLSKWTQRYFWTNALENSTVLQQSLFLLGFVFLYYFVSECYWSQTLAKLITKTVIVTKRGDKPTIKMVFIRTLGRFIPFEPFSFLRNRPIGWHDQLSATYVIKKE
jgi:uncharacterized RDD family membrane protein YckC